MIFFLICIFRFVLVHTNRNHNQKSWKLILRTFIFQASCEHLFLLHRLKCGVTIDKKVFMVVRIGMGPGRNGSISWFSSFTKRQVGAPS